MLFFVQTATSQLILYIPIAMKSKREDLTARFTKSRVWQPFVAMDLMAYGLNFRYYFQVIRYHLPKREPISSSGRAGGMGHPGPWIFSITIVTESMHEHGPPYRSDGCISSNCLISDQKQKGQCQVECQFAMWEKLFSTVWCSYMFRFSCQAIGCRIRYAKK